MEASQAGLLPNEQFPVESTLIEAWASLKRFRPEETPPLEAGCGRNPEVDFHGDRRLKQMYVSSTDPEARLSRKG